MSCLTLFLIIIAAKHGILFRSRKKDSSNANSSTAGGIAFDKTDVCIGDGDPSSLPDSSQNSSSVLRPILPGNLPQIQLPFPSVFPYIRCHDLPHGSENTTSSYESGTESLPLSIHCKSQRFRQYPSFQRTGFPGKAISGIPLSDPLSQGDYTLEIHIDTHTLNGNSEMNGGNVPVGLHVM